MNSGLDLVELLQLEGAVITDDLLRIPREGMVRMATTSDVLSVFRKGMSCTLTANDVLGVLGKRMSRTVTTANLFRVLALFCKGVGSSFLYGNSLVTSSPRSMLQVRRRHRSVALSVGDKPLLCGLLLRVNIEI